MQQHSLLATKLYIPPIRPELVSRPRLVERLNAGLNGSLTLVSAPAGFGKTTLVSEWLQEIRAQAHGNAMAPLQAAWLSLDEGDNDPVRFLAYLIAALWTLVLPVPSVAEGSGVGGTETSIGQGMLSALQSPQPPPAEAVLISLINEIAAIPGSMILVLDDHHSIESSAVDDALAFLLEHLPPQMHLVIATREDPHLPLARLRARGQLTELRATDLRFTSSEAAEFLNQAMGLGLSAEDVAELEGRTEGWIAGLQLAALALQGVALQGTNSIQGRKDASSLIRSFSGSHRYVLDYLVQEVLEQQPESVQTFLQRTSILNRLTGPLCDAVCFGVAETQSSSNGTAVRSAGTAATGQGDGQTILERLEQANLFIVPLDDQRRWYRYHHLFADLLRQRLRQTQPDLLPVLHRSASDWYEQNGIVDEAIEHSLQGESLERAAFLVEQQADAVWGRGEHTKLYRWLARLPSKIWLTRPQLCILQACYQFTSGQQDAAEQSLLAADNALSQSFTLAIETAPVERDPKEDPSRMKVQGRVAAIRAELAFYQGDVQRLNAYSRQALEYLPEQDLPWRSIATAALGDAYSFIGEMEPAYRVRSEAVELSRAGGNIYMMLVSSMKLAVTLRQQGRLQQVTALCQQQLQLANDSGMSQTDVAGCLSAIWGEILAEINDLEGAIDRAEKGVALAERGGDVAMLGWSYVCLMRILFSRGDTAGAQEIIHKTEKIGRESDMPPWIANQVSAWQTRIWLAQDKVHDASQWVLERGLSVAGEIPFLRELSTLY